MCIYFIYMKPLFVCLIPHSHSDSRSTSRVTSLTIIPSSPLLKLPKKSTLWFVVSTLSS